VVFNIYNKKVLNVFPYPWLTSTLSLAAGSSIMLVSWATRLVKSPELDVEFWKALAPVRLSPAVLPFSANLRRISRSLINFS
jgi:solute carrier family 35 protein E1